uniref:Uncharacterized protein n=1 Tax=Anopheles atroparvus TaxID=41427 RepID=A0A182ILT9_ANOAO
MNVKLFSVVVFLLAYPGESLTERPAFGALDYLPGLEYFLQVLRSSSQSLAHVELDATLWLPASVSKMLDNARVALRSATLAAQNISAVLGQEEAMEVKPLVTALHAIRSSLCETDFHFPEYFYNQTVAEEIEQLKSSLSEQVDSVPLEGLVRESSVGWDLQLVNGVLTRATSVAMSTTLVVRQIVAVEQMKASLKLLFIPAKLDETVLQDLLDIGSQARSYNGMYREKLNSGSETFLRVATGGNLVLQSVLTSSPGLPQTVRDAVVAFTSEVLRFTQHSLAELQSTTNAADATFDELFQSTLYAAYGLESSAMAMLRPLPRNMACVRVFLPLAHTLAGTRLASFALCNNEASGLLYQQGMQYREQLRQLQQNAFDQLQVAQACDPANCHAVHAETTGLFNAMTETVQGFAPDFDTYRGLLFDCINGKAEATLASVIDLAYNFNHCVRLREAEAKLVSSNSGVSGLCYSSVSSVSFLVDNTPSAGARKGAGKTLYDARSQGQTAKGDHLPPLVLWPPSVCVPSSPAVAEQVCAESASATRPRRPSFSCPAFPVHPKR